LVTNTKIFFNLIRPILLLSTTNIINIQCNEVLIETIIEFVHLLPNLDTLVINCSAIIQLKRASIEEIEIFRDVSTNNKITKIFLQRMILIPESIVRFIFMKNIKYIPNLISMDIRISNSNEETIKKIE
jgi:hypothetical protein